IVYLLSQTIGDLSDEGAGVEARKRGADDPSEESDVAQVGRDAAGDAGILDLHGDGASVSGDRPVNLADRGGGEGQRVPLSEELFGLAAELLPDDRGGQLRP